MTKDELITYDSHLVDTTVKDIIERVIAENYVEDHNGDPNDILASSLRFYLVEYIENFNEDGSPATDDEDYECLECFLHDSAEAFIIGWCIGAGHPVFSAN
jgi:hypothetical protein